MQVLSNTSSANALCFLCSDLDSEPIDVVSLDLLCGDNVPCSRVLFRLCLLGPFLLLSCFICLEGILVASSLYQRGENRESERSTYITISVILTGFAGLSVPGLTGTASNASNTSSPPTNFPKTVCFLSRWGVDRNVIYHCDLGFE